MASDLSALAILTTANRRAVYQNPGTASRHHVFASQTRSPTRTDTPNGAPASVAIPSQSPSPTPTPSQISPPLRSTQTPPQIRLRPAVTFPLKPGETWMVFFFLYGVFCSVVLVLEGILCMTKFGSLGIWWAYICVAGFVCIRLTVEYQVGTLFVWKRRR